MKKARHTSVLWARRILLALTLAVVVGIGALYLFGREQRSAGFPSEREGDGSGENAVMRLVGKGFDIDLTDGGRRLASVSASRLASKKQDSYQLEDVRIEAEREGGGIYRISSRRATYNIRANTADLEGDVHIEGPDGMTLSTEGLQMRRHGRTVVSTSPVSFSLGPNYLGSARQLDANLRHDQFALAGDVQVRTIAGLSPAVALDSQRAAYDRKAGILRTEGDVDLRHGEDRIQARRLTVHLAEDEHSIRFAQALWEVHATVHLLADDGVPQVITADAHELAVQLDEAGRPQRMELESGPHPLAWVQIADLTGLVRHFEAGFLEGIFAGGHISRLGGNEDVQLVETLDLDPRPLLRRLCGDDLTATFGAEGEIDTFTLDGSVDYTEPWSQAETRSMERDRSTGDVILSGEGTWIARQGVRLEAPRIVLDPETSQVHAVDGVRTDMEQTNGVRIGVGAEGRDEPVHVVSNEATYDPVDGFRFVDDVRAWQGRNYMLARTFGGTAERVTAEGSVKTVWHDAAQPVAAGTDEPETETGPTSDEPDTDSEGNDAEGGGNPLIHRKEADADDAAQPLEVFAQQLVWENDSGVVEYQGAARAQQGRRNMRCANIRVHLAEDNEVELMECDGPVQIEDPVGGNKVYGDAAEYRPGGDNVLVLGDPVRLVETSGAEFKGKAMRYDFTTGRAELDSLSGRETRPFVEGDQTELMTPTDVLTVVDGRSFLIARQARTEGDHIAVRGPLRLSWEAEAPPEPEEPTEEPEPAEPRTEVVPGTGGQQVRTIQPTAPPPPPKPEPIDVYAVNLDYDRSTRIVSLQGAIRFRHGSRLLRCAELDLQLTAEQRVERAVCRGTAQAQETSRGDVLSGNVATYDTVSGEVVVTGAPARLRRASGVETEASEIHYELGTGRVQMGADDETDDENGTDAETSAPDGAPDDGA